MGRTTKITAGDIMLMEELRKQGLANQQIAHDMGLDPTTVYKYIGNQGKKVRAAYGSMVTHCAGEKFSKDVILNEAGDISDKNTFKKIDGFKPVFEEYKKPLETKLSPSLNRTGSIVTYKGASSITYTVDTYDELGISTIAIKSKDIIGDGLHFSLDSLDIFIKELIELSTDIRNSQKKPAL